MVDELPTVKERALGIIRGMPNDSSFDDILRELVFARNVERGLADAEAERTISSEELARRIESWAGDPWDMPEASDERSIVELLSMPPGIEEVDFSEVERARYREIRARVEALDAGKPETLPWSEVRARLGEGLDESSKD